MTTKTTTQSEPVDTITRNGDVLFVFRDSNRHQRRIQRAVLSDRDRLFWVTIAIACGQPGRISKTTRVRTRDLPKRYGHLKNARNDLDAFYEYYRPMMLGDPFLVGHPPGSGKSAGYFDFTVDLNNPTAGELNEVVEKVRAWLAQNSDDPEYQGFQINFSFSGHGQVDQEGAASIVIGDGVLPAAELASLLLRCSPRPLESHEQQCRVDLYLDCCHAGAVARSLYQSLLEQVPAYPRAPLGMGQVYCACLDDENAFELANLPHSVFTFAFLNECSRKQPPGASRTNLGLRDVGWFTNSQQHPLLIDFMELGGLNLKFPSSYYVRRPPLPSIPPREPALRIDESAYMQDPFAELLRFARSQRTACLNIERELARQTTFPGTYSRNELLTNTKFPFL